MPNPYRRLLVFLIPIVLLAVFAIAGHNAPADEGTAQPGPLSAPPPAQAPEPAPAPIAVPAPSGGNSSVAPAPHPSVISSVGTPYSLQAKYVGAAGCAAANCHGGDALKQIQGSEHSLWVQQDPHAGAYNVLYNNTSRRIMKYLRQSPRYAYLKSVPAHEAKICLDCHATAPSKERLVDGHKFSLSDGVGCESCHGPAEKWLDPHKRDSWNAWSSAEKAAIGFVDTKDILQRTKMCASCHVGAIDREVNHDIMAGGHPRLNFEMSAYHANLPAHWNRNADRRRHAVNDPHVSAEYLQSTFQAKLWKVGQLAAAEKSLELLEERAANPQRVWPEFTEYGCYACHHNLQPPLEAEVDKEGGSWRQERGYPKRKPGHYPYGTWQFAMLPDLPLFGDAGPFGGKGDFNKLSTEMGKPYPNREKVTSLARSVRLQLSAAGHQVAHNPLTIAESDALLQHYLDHAADRPIDSWDTAAQSYLTLVALYQGVADAKGRALDPTAKDKQIFAGFARARELLKFPSNYDSPKDFEEEAFTRRENLKTLLKELQKQMTE